MVHVLVPASLAKVLAGGNKSLRLEAVKYPRDEKCRQGVRGSRVVQREESRDEDGLLV